MLRGIDIERWSRGLSVVFGLTSTVERHATCSGPVVFLHALCLNTLLCHKITSREEDLRKEGLVTLLALY